eukprot:6189534-Pleurochrysis_carterae.AAC.3
MFSIEVPSEVEGDLVAVGSAATKDVVEMGNGHGEGWEFSLREKVKVQILGCGEARRVGGGGEMPHTQ